MRAVLIFLFLIPAFAALGHDLYLFHEQHGTKPMSVELFQKEFKFSALGFLWTRYDLASYKETVASMPAEDWAKIDKMLTNKTFYVALTFAGVMTGFFFLLGLFGIGPFKKDENATANARFGRQSKKSSKDTFRAGGESKKMQYKRK